MPRACYRPPKSRRNERQLKANIQYRLTRNIPVRAGPTFGCLVWKTWPAPVRNCIYMSEFHINFWLYRNERPQSFYIAIAVALIRPVIRGTHGYNQRLLRGGLFSLSPFIILPLCPLSRLPSVTKSTSIIPLPEHLSAPIKRSTIIPGPFYPLIIINSPKSPTYTITPNESSTKSTCA